MPKTFHLTVLPNGDVHCDYDGFSGTDCALAEAQLLRDAAAFGLVVQPRRRQRKATTVGNPAASGRTRVCI
jgi:hypothetical protein